MDDVLESLGIHLPDGVKFDDLTTAEHDTLSQWLSSLQKQELTLVDVRTYLEKMRDAVEDKLSDTPETETIFLFFQRPNRESVILKARLKNYMLLLAFLYSPERAKRALQKTIDGMQA